MSHIMKTDIYKKNMKVLKRKLPQIYEYILNCESEYPFSHTIFSNKNNEINAVVKLPDGHEIFLYEGDSIVDRIKNSLSAQELNNNDLLMCTGMGLGYLPLTAIKIYSQTPRIVVIEPYPETFKLAIASVDLTEMFEYEKIDIYLGRETAITSIIGKYVDEFYIGKCRRITHLPSRNIFGEKFISVEKKIEETVNNLLIGWNTTRKYGEILNKNSIHNLVSLFDGTTIDHLKDNFQNIPAIVVASGPSLEKDLNTIKEVKQNALILSCDSSVRPLVNEKIIPHMIFSVDYKNMNFDKLKLNLEELRESIFVYWMEANIDSVRGFLGNKRVGVMSRNEFNNALIHSIFGNKFCLPGDVSSNSDMAVLTAIHLGCNPIILVGMDLAFSDGKDHVAGSVLREYQNKKDMVLVEGLDGSSVYSLMPMVAGRVILENNIQKHDRDIIDVSLSGAYIKGSKIRSFEEVKQGILKQGCNVEDYIGKVSWAPNIGPEKAEAPMEKVTNIAEQLEKDAQKHLVNICKLKKSKARKQNNQIVIKIKQSLSKLTQFKNTHRIGLIMVQNYCYTDQLDIDRSIANIGSDGASTVEDINNQTLDIQLKFYRTIYLAARKAHRQIGDKNKYFREINRLNSKILSEKDELNNSLILARRHAKEGMVWLSERAYKLYLQHHPCDISAITELSELYMGIGLWKQVIALLASSSADGTDNSRLEHIKTKINEHLSDILESAQSKISSNTTENKKLNEARREILEVQSVFPDDPKAISLLNRIKEIEKQQEIEINNAVGFTHSPEKYLQLEEKANRLTKEGENEKAIGIYEGLIKKDPEKENIYRILIGDLRFGTKDYTSALWHYKRGIQHSPNDEKLLFRSRFVNPVLETMPFETNHMKYAATVVVLCSDALDDLRENLKRLEKVIHAPCEFILLCSTAQQRHTCSELINTRSKSSENRYAIIETNDKNVTSINQALKVSNGKVILLADSGCLQYYNFIPYLRKLIEKRNSVGIAGSGRFKDRTENSLQHGDESRIDKGSAEISEGLCLGFSVYFLKKTGLLDESFESIYDAFEDLRTRAILEDFENIVVSADRKCSPDDEYFREINSNRLGHKWITGNIPANYERKYEIYNKCKNAMTLYERSETDTAINTLINGIKKYPYCDIFYRAIAQILMSEKRWSEAMQSLDALPDDCHKNPENIGLKFRDIWDQNTIYAYSQFYSGEIVKAMECSEKILAESPADAKILALKGIYAFYEKDFHTAKTFFTLAIRADHDFGLPWFFLGKIYRIKGDDNKSFKLTQKAFVVSPEDGDVSNCYYQFGCTDNLRDQAINRFEDAIKTNPENKNLHYLFIDLLIQSKQYEKAMKVIEKSIILFGKKDGIIDAALSIRDQLGPEGKGTNGQNQPAAVSIDSEIDKIERFFYKLKRTTDKIDFLDKGTTPISKNIATVFGATIIPGNNTADNCTEYKWVFRQDDVLNCIHDTDKVILCDRGHACQ